MCKLVISKISLFLDRVELYLFNTTKQLIIQQHLSDIIGSPCNCCLTDQPQINYTTSKLQNHQQYS